MCVRVHACDHMWYACALYDAHALCPVHVCGVCMHACDHMWYACALYDAVLCVHVHVCVVCVLCMHVITCGMHVHTGSAPSGLPPSPSLETRGSSKACVLGCLAKLPGAPHLAFFPKGVSLL